MNRKLRVTGLFILILLCFYVLVWWLFFSQPSAPVKEVHQQKAKQPPKVQKPQQVVPPEQKVQKSKNEGLREGLSLLNHQPIEFYGRAVDQYGEPVVGAEVRGHVQINDGYRETLEKHQTTTDSNGMFEFHGFSGRDLGIAVSKSGYLRESEHTANSYFKYSLMFREKVHKPDPNNPVIFKMWKLAGAEPMVEVDKTFRIPYDGTPAIIDLVHGKQTESVGDLKLTLIRNPLEVKRGQQNYFWSFSITPIEGGLIETKDSFMYLAPEQGYISEWKHDVDPVTTNWSAKAEVIFYLKSRAGKNHARVQLAVYSDTHLPNAGVGVTIKSWLNPSGSRNLEYDPNKRISPERIAQIGLEKAIEEARDPDERERKHLESLGIPSSGK